MLSEDYDDDIPPLEDMSGELRRAAKGKEKSSGAPSVNSQTPQSARAAGQTSAPTAVSKAQAPPAKACTASPPQRLAGFLNQPPAKAAKPQPRSSSKNNITVLKPTQSKQDSLRFDEVQEAMKASMPQLDQKEWMTPDLLNRVEQDAVLGKLMEDPDFQQFIAMMQSDPKRAMQKYGHRQDFAKGMQQFMGMMGHQFDQLATGREETARQDKVRQMSAELDSHERSIVENVLQDKELQSILSDPDMQRLLGQMRAQPHSIPSAGYEIPSTPPPPISAQYQNAQVVKSTAAAKAKPQDPDYGRRAQVFGNLITAVKLVDKVWPGQPVTEPLIHILEILREDAQLGVNGERAAVLCARLLECLLTIKKQFNDALPAPLAGFLGDFEDKLMQIQSCVQQYQREQRWWLRIIKTRGSLERLSGMEDEVKDLLQYTHFTYSIYASGLTDVAAREPDADHLIDDRTPEDFREEAKDPSSPKFRHAVLSLAKQYEDADDPDFFEAIFWYKYLAERAKDAAAAAYTAIGNILQYGKGDYICNYVEARKYYEQAFKLNDCTAMTRIGRMYLEGKLSDGGVAKEYVAVECFHQALNRNTDGVIQGDVAALSLLGWMHEQRADTIKNSVSDSDVSQHQLEYLRDAEDNYYEGVQKGNAVCVVHLTKLYQRFDQMNIPIKYERKKKLTEVKNELERNDDPRILLETALSVLRTAGRSVVKDLLEKALKHGHKLAACYLGKVEEHSKNLRGAEAYFQRSARAQCPEGLRCLGAFLLKYRKELVWQNDRTENDCIKEAIKALEGAVRYGDGLSALYLANYNINKKTSDGRTEGIRWYREGIRLKNVDCMRSLAELCAKDGFLQDLDFSVSLYRKAAQLNDPEAQLQLAQYHADGLRSNDWAVWTIEQDRKQALVELEKLSKLPDQDLKPLLRVATFLHLGRLEGPEYPKERDQFLTDTQKVQPLKKAKGYLLRAFSDLAEHDRLQRTTDTTARQLEQPHHLLEDESEELMVDPTVLTRTFTSAKLGREIAFALVILLLSQATDACAELAAHNPQGERDPAAQEKVNTIYKILRTAICMAYIGATEKDCSQCAIAMGWLCEFPIPEDTSPLDDFAAMLKGCPTKFDNSFRYWWFERSLASLRCARPKADSKGPCSTISSGDWETVSIRVKSAFTEIERALRLEQRSAYETLWNLGEAVANISQEGDLLCPECEPVRSERLFFSRRFHESCHACDHDDYHVCPHQMDGGSSSDDDGVDNESADSPRKDFVQRVVRLIAEKLMSPVTGESVNVPEVTPEVVAAIFDSEPVAIAKPSDEATPVATSSTDEATATPATADAAE
ncbi:hypothetical protein RI367_002043 [Sorochytrium milnesiophthora]